jgi:AcrR family transcriptional regulator
VLDAATELVRAQGSAALTMRRLAAELGCAVTAIYWNVGNREALLDELVARTVRDMGRSVLRATRPPPGPSPSPSRCAASCGTARTLSRWSTNAVSPS